jgi:hypothetical protein
MSESGQKVQKSRRRIDLTAAALLSLGGVATTFCGFEASLWGGKQSAAYGRAAGARTESTKVYIRAGQLALIDVSAFLTWMEADVEDRQKLRDAVQRRLRDDFKPAFEEWLAAKDSPEAAETPFALPSYDLPERRHADELAREAEQLFEEGQHANAETGHYMLCSLIFAMGLFFAGVGHQFHKPRMRVALLGVSAALLLLGGYRLLVLPTALPAPIPHEPDRPKGFSLAPLPQPPTCLTPAKTSRSSATHGPAAHRRFAVRH